MISRRVLSYLLAAVLVAAGISIGLFASRSTPRYLTAYFPRVTGIYLGSSVRILGVPVGTVTQLTVQGTRVKVEISYGAKYRLPANVDAVIVPPSIVSDRYIGLAPVYTGGPVFPDHGVIPQSRTEVPVELDQIFAEINQLNVAMGPKGANSKGALSHLIQVSAANLAGNGTQFNAAITEFSKLLSTLAANRGNFFATLSNLEQFNAVLAQDNGGVRQVSSDLAVVSGQLNGERQDLALALRNLAIALGQVATFVQDNRTQLTNDIGGLTKVTSALLTQKKSIQEFLDEAPLALENLALTYDPASQTLRTRDNTNKYGQSPPNSPLNPICQLAQSLGLSCAGLSAPGSSPFGASSGSAKGGLASLLGVAP